MEKKAITLKNLFLTTFLLSGFTFGGGYVIITLIQKKLVSEYKWIAEEQMLELVAIAQSSPGAIAVNSSIVIGYQLKGIKGIFVCVLATILPPFIIISIVSLFYQAFASNPYINTMLEGMQAGVAAVISVVVLEMFLGLIKDKKHLSILIAIVVFIIQYIFSIHIALILGFFIILGVIKTIYYNKENQI